MRVNKTLSTTNTCSKTKITKSLLYEIGLLCSISEQTITNSLRRRGISMRWNWLTGTANSIRFSSMRNVFGGINLPLLLMLCLYVPNSYAAAITSYTSVQVNAGFLNINTPNSASGSQLFSTSFGPPTSNMCPCPQTLLSFSGTASALAGVLKANISLSASSQFQGSTFVPVVWGGASGAAIASWGDTWAIAAHSFSNGNLSFTFNITGTGPGSLTIDGQYADNTPFGVSQRIDGVGARSVTISIPINTHGTPTQIKTTLVAGNGGFGPFPGFYSSSYQNTVTLSSLALQDSTGTPVVFTLDTASGDPFFAALAPPSTSSTPEPAAFTLFATGLLALIFARLRNQPRSRCSNPASLPL